MNGLGELADALKRGDPVIVPTDTVYGVAVMPHVAGAVDRLFELKGRPTSKPLPVLGGSIEDLEKVVDFDDRGRALADRFWPGPLTLVLPRSSGFTPDLGGARDDIGVRIPASVGTMALLREVGPLAVTSANRSGEPPAVTAAEARGALPAIAHVLDEGPCSGMPSTVATLDPEVRVLREGAVVLGDLTDALASRP